MSEVVYDVGYDTRKIKTRKNMVSKEKNKEKQLHKT